MSLWHNADWLFRTVPVRWISFAFVLHGIPILLVAFGAAGPARQAAMTSSYVLYGIFATAVGSVGLLMGMPFKRKEPPRHPRMHGVIDASDRDEMAHAIWDRAGGGSSPHKVRRRRRTL